MLTNEQIIEQYVNKLLTLAKQNNISDSDINLLVKTINFAKWKHESQLRKSGEPYIIHPIATATILLMWKMDLDTIITGILHDVLEDTLTTEEEIRDNFGLNVLNLVKCVTKVNLLSKQNRNNLVKDDQIENNYVIQVFLSMSNDIRGMIVKLADRFHNMTTIKYLSPEKQIRFANETLEIYSKVAGRLGMYRLRTDLEDLSFEVINPIEFKNTKNSIDKIVENNRANWKNTKGQIANILNSYNIDCEIKERFKGIYSTWLKTIKNYSIRDIHDIYAIRIIVKENLDCYKVLGLVHMNFNFLKNAFKDYISNPKLNLYQSIHTTIVKNQSLMEVQIRTVQMDKTAEYGIAAHWNYKEHVNNKSEINQSISLINEIASLSNVTVDKIKKVTNDNVFDVLLVNNETKYVVNNKTRVIDLAFRFNNETFSNLSKITVNGQIVTFDTLLKPNDVIKFSYSSNVCIRPYWIKFTQFDTTKDGINKILEQLTHNKIMNEDNFLNKLSSSLKDNFIGLNKAELLIKKKLKLPSIKDFLAFINSEVYNDPQLIQWFNKHKNIARQAYIYLKKKYGHLVKKKKQFYFNMIDGLYFKDLLFPNCCNKIPKMDVVGKLSKTNILEIHSANCHNVNNTKTKIYPLVWNEELLKNNDRKFRYQDSFTADWMPSIGNVISKKLIEYNLMINELKIEKNKQNNICKIHIVVYASDILEIKSCFASLNQEIVIHNLINFNNI